MKLSKEILSGIKRSDISVPSGTIFLLPEKILQFGTGVLLRGLCDYFIDKANKKNIFNGRIVVVKSTDKGDTAAFDTQNSLYTHIVKGMEGGKILEEKIINASVSRVLSAKHDWEKILEYASGKEMQIIISNTTEVGIAYVEENIFENIPQSFPGKLLACLYRRYEIFKGDVNAGMIIIPTELITDNGKKLKEILLQLAAYNQLGNLFIVWLQTANHFCNSLVDRIVPGKVIIKENEFGYTDDLAIMSEVYRLWAIETSNEQVRKKLSFAQADSGVIVAPDIYKYRELKLRLLNGTHTLSCGLAVLSGFKTVKEAMNDKNFRNFVTRVMLDEIAPAIAGEEISDEEAKNFGEKVIDRFSNPYIEHQWLSITLQYSSKMMMRDVPVLLKHYNKSNTVPVLMAVGFAAYIVFMKSRKNKKGEFVGNANNTDYIINDNKASLLYEHWKQKNINLIVQQILADKNLWNTNLNDLNNFADAVIKNVTVLMYKGAKTFIKTI